MFLSIKRGWCSFTFSIALRIKRDNEVKFLAQGLVCSYLWSVNFFLYSNCCFYCWCYNSSWDRKVNCTKLRQKLPYVTRSVSFTEPCDWNHLLHCCLWVLSWHLPSHCPALWQKVLWRPDRFAPFSRGPCFSGQEQPNYASLSSSISTTVWNLPTKLIYFPSLVRLFLD